MEDAAPAVATVVGTALLSLAYAVVLGSVVARGWLARRRSHWAVAAEHRLWWAALVASIAGFAAALALAWQEATGLSDGGAFAQTFSVLGALLTGTHYGHATLVGWVGWAVVLGCSAWPERRPSPLPGPRTVMLWASGIGLVIAACSRSVMGHAASGPQGDFSWAVLFDVLHQLCTLLWTGDVVLAGWVVFGARRADPLIGADRIQWVDGAAALSRRATMALTGVVLTGSYATWRNVGTLALPFTLSGDGYLRALQWKLAAVAVAVALGACNRFAVLPHLKVSTTPNATAPRRFVGVLRAESVVLCVVIVLAAVLSTRRRRQ